METTTRSRTTLPLFLLALLVACSGGGGGTTPTVGTGGDTDGDGLSDSFELDGWEIVLDIQGYGLAADAALLTVRKVTSDPANADSDGDGLSDGEEFQLRTDPRHEDSDLDLLTDFEELERWGTNPSSADSDADARGPDGNLVPDTRLFDGREVQQLGTSPTIADTDGDNRTDFEEANEAAFDPRIADLPRGDLQLEGEIDVRLNVEYSEMQGQELQYGTTQSTSSTSSIASSTSRTHGTESSYSYGFEETATIAPPSKASFGGSINLQFTETSWDETTTGLTKETAETAGSEHSRLQVDSRVMTEVTSSGSIRVGLRIRNKGRSSFTLNDLGISVLQWLPQDGLGGGTFKTMATLKPALSSLTLGPGAQSGILEVSSTSVDPNVIRDFLAYPSSLVLQPANFDMENADGINFSFLTENTFTRTALVEIDYGDGNVQSWRIATNVERDSEGNFLGARLGDVLTNVLDIPEGNPFTGFTVAPGSSSDGAPVGNVLVAVRGFVADDVVAGGIPSSFWSVAGTREGMLEPGGNFEDIRLRAGDQLRLLYTVDADRDGVYAREEAFYGTSDDDPDTDGDGIEDRIEAKFGWLAGVDSGLPGFPRQVFSNPRRADTDADGLLDADEREVGTDPTMPDTDEDGLADGVDPFPLLAAGRLYVRQGASGDGSSWDFAHGELRDALDHARDRGADEEPANDVAEIWVAQGLYVPTAGGDQSISFALPPSVALYGGFVGDETKRGERNSDPFTNNCVLSGDLMGNDGGSSQSRDDNSYHVVFTGDADRASVIDGFEIRGGNAYGADSDDWNGAGIYGFGEPVLRNLNINGNRARFLGGGAYVGGSGVGPRFENCWIIGNRAEGQPSPSSSRGGGMYLLGDGRMIDCRLQNNYCEGRGGALAMRGRWVVERTTVNFNNRARRAAGIYVVQAGARFVDCDVSGNQTLDTPDGPALPGGGLYWENHGSPHVLSLVNCRFWNNAAKSGGGIQVDASSGVISVVNTTVVGNRAFKDSPTPQGGGLHAFGFTQQPSVEIVNSIFWGNHRLQGGAKKYDEGGQIAVAGVDDVSISSTCIEGLSSLGGSGNIGNDPFFVNEEQGNLRLLPNSPCIETGFNQVDLDPLAPGIQLVPPFDLEGNRRIRDGDGLHGSQIDLGAYEFQP